MDQESICWSKWGASYSDGETPSPKTHILSDDGNTTLCGKDIPSVTDVYQVSIMDIEFANCKACKALNHNAA